LQHIEDEKILNNEQYQPPVKKPKKNSFLVIIIIGILILLVGLYYLLLFNLSYDNLSPGANSAAGCVTMAIGVFGTFMFLLGSGLLAYGIIHSF
jgi:flagellar basal body-associated protein FliL